MRCVELWEAMEAEPALQKLCAATALHRAADQAPGRALAQRRARWRGTGR